MASLTIRKMNLTGMPAGDRARLRAILVEYDAANAEEDAERADLIALIDEVDAAARPSGPDTRNG